jgi:hypothetical protein
MADDDRISELERSFRRAGLPTFVRGYSARRAFAKALPLLTVVFVLEILNALNFAFGFWTNVGFLAGGIAISLGIIGLLNMARGQRLISVPRRVGPAEMIVFVLVPSVLPVLFGGQTTSAAVTLVGNTALLGLVYLVLGFGTVSILEWAVRRFVSLFAASLTVLVRALSLLLFFLLVIFFTTETWQIWTVPGLPKFAAAAGLFVILAAGFLLLRLPGSVRGLEAELPGEHLSRTQRVNVGLVMFLSQFLQVVFVAFAVWVFFVVFGSLLVSAGVREAWLGTLGTEIVRIPFFGDSVVVITQELLRVATGMASFAALYYAAATQLDEAYRDEVVERIAEQMKETFARRAEYLQLVGGSPAP